MIVELLLNVVYAFVYVTTLPMNIPDLPQEALNYVEQLFGYLSSGASILANYTPLGYLMVLFGLILAIDVGIKLYHLVMWILKKIPVLGIE